MHQLFDASHPFAIPSFWEGFPNALAEALAHGLPAIGFAEAKGVNSLIIDGKTDGYPQKWRPGKFRCPNRKCNAKPCCPKTNGLNRNTKRCKIYEKEAFGMLAAAN